MADPFVTVNGFPAIAADITRPRVGVWHAELTVDAQTMDGLTGRLQVIVAGQMTFLGTARRSGVRRETVFLRVVGGAGGLGQTIPARSWVNVPLRIPLSDALLAVGEVLSPSCDPNVLNALLPKWSRPSRGAGVEVGALLAAVPGAAWRVLPDGTIWVGQETWPTVSIDYEEIEFEPSLGRLELGSDLPSIAPGQVFAGAGEPYAGSRVSSVQHVAAKDRIRHFLFFEDASFTAGDPDRTLRGLTTFVRSIVDKRLDPLALYPAKVVAQNGDGSLELVPDDPRWPGFSHVPIRLGIPGASVKISAGRVLLGFAGGDPQKPIAELWEGGATVTELDLGGATIKIGAGATDALVKGTTYRSAEDTLLTALVTALNTIAAATTPSTAAAATTFGTAVTTFKAGSYLSTVGKTA